MCTDTLRSHEMAHNWEPMKHNLGLQSTNEGIARPMKGLCERKPPSIILQHSL